MMDIAMQNNDLKSLVTQMYDNLLDLIDQQENTTKKQVVNYLKDAVQTIDSIDDNRLNSMEHAKEAFTNAYEEIANKSISSYKTSNGKFKELTQMHQDTINEYLQENEHIPSITEKFNKIQTQMHDEVLKANQVISQLTKQIKTLEKKSNIDALTKVFNRRALITYLNKICYDKGINYELHLLVLDIDDFKIVNDTYGHIAGDKILIYISNILKKTLRDGDKVFRYGGEEFVIILNRINEETCIKITNRLLELIRVNQLIYKGQNIQVTASIGATKYHDQDTPDIIIERADKALYKAKHNGKNTMVSEA